MATLSYVNIIVEDMEGVAGFYSKLLGLKEIVENRSDIFRGYHCGDASLGISATKAYELLALRRPDGEGERNIITFDLDSRADVDRVSALVEKLGGTLTKEPFETYYGWYQSVLRDPEGNAFRVNFPG